MQTKLKDPSSTSTHHPISHPKDRLSLFLASQWPRSECNAAGFIHQMLGVDSMERIFYNCIGVSHCIMLRFIASRLV